MASVRHAEFVLERGDDVWVWDRDGRRYLDATASLWYANVGHGRREIAEAAVAQLERLEAYSTFGDFANEPALELAATLADLAPMPARVFLVSGGGDAIDTAAKLARQYWSQVGEPDRTILISRTAGYHGTHGYGTALAGIPANREGFGPQVDTIQVPHDSIEAMHVEMERADPSRIAAVFVEPVIGAGGVYPPMPGYLEGLSELCRQTGVLLVVDAVICGFGRLGTWFGIERWQADPAMIVFAKGVTSGYLPLGGVIVCERVAEPFWTTPGGPVLRHGPTYSGHPTCCAAALANLALLGRERLVERGRDLEGALLDALAPLREHDAVAEVRGGTGMMAAVELRSDVLDTQAGAIAKVTGAAREAGVIVRPLGRAVAVSPPLTATPEHFQLIAQALDHALDSLSASLSGTR
ncbi:MAG: aspartate aminotransferase family protein [Solirubrobacterales bacterium]|nr:aspartate aminotransferase family protein [Solirubrobacterales bacterium]MBV9164670.1 aspartate aminotransferase family protein [Solirubrobacterales bacterium]